MKLLEAFDIQIQDNVMVSLVGGGGKSSIMFKLAQELKAEHRRVLVTTTTNIYNPDKSLYDHFFLWNDKKIHDIKKQDLRQGSITVIGSRITDEQKLKGINKEYVDELYSSGVYDAILVEADGAKRKPIKAPDVHEPVVPEYTSILAGVIGMDCYGKAIDTAWVHRPHILAEIAGRTVGDAIDDSVITRLALSPDGLFKNCPGKAEKVMFINKVEGIDIFSAAERIGNSVLTQSPDIRKVLIGSILGKEPVRSVMGRET